MTPVINSKTLTTKHSMGSGSSKAKKSEPKANVPAPEPTTTPAPVAVAKPAKKDEKKDDKKDKKAAPPPSPVVKKAEAFEVAADDGPRTASGKALPARLQHLEKKEKKTLSGEELEAKLAAAEERRTEQQVESISKIKEHTDRVNEVKSGAADGVDVKRKVCNGSHGLIAERRRSRDIRGAQGRNSQRYSGAWMHGGLWPYFM